MAEGEIINRVTNSALVSIDMDELMAETKSVFFDLKPYLFQEMILREKDFRASMKEHDWEQYKDVSVVVGCSADAIIPTWAYMLVTSKLAGVASLISFGGSEDLEKSRIDQMIGQIQADQFLNKKVVIKGCGELQLRDYAFVEISKILLPVVSSLMYGEPCSTVPIYKQPRKKTALSAVKN